MSIFRRSAIAQLAQLCALEPQPPKQVVSWGQVQTWLCQMLFYTSLLPVQQKQRSLGLTHGACIFQQLDGAVQIHRPHLRLLEKSHFLGMAVRPRLQGA